MNKVLWSLINAIGGRGFSVIWAVLLGNLILPDKMGTYVALMLIVQYTLSLAFINLESGAVQKINSTENREEKNEYFSWGLLLNCVICLFVITILYLLKNSFLTWFKLEEFSWLYSLILPLLLFKILRKYFDKITTTNYQFKPRALINLSASGLQIVFGIGLLWLGYGLAGVIGGIYIANATASILLGYICLKTFKLNFSGIKSEIGFDLIKFSSVLYFSSIAVFLDAKLDLFFVNYYLPKDHLALYNYAIQGAFLLVMFATGISHVTFPKMTTSFAREKDDEFQRTYENSIDFTYFILSFLTLIGGIYSKFFIGIVLPEFYVEMAYPVLILASVILMFASFSSVGAIFTARGIPGYGLWLNWGSLIINVILLAILVPSYGYMGAAISTAFTFGIKTVGTGFLVEFKIGTDYNYVRLIGSYLLFVTLLISGFLLDNQLIRIGIIITYFCYLLFVFFNVEKRNLLKQWFRSAVSYLPTVS